MVNCVFAWLSNTPGSKVCPPSLTDIIVRLTETSWFQVVMYDMLYPSGFTLTSITPNAVS